MTTLFKQGKPMRSSIVMVFIIQIRAYDPAGSLLPALHSCCMQRRLPVPKLDQNPLIQAAHQDTETKTLTSYIRPINVHY